MKELGFIWNFKTGAQNVDIRKALESSVPIATDQMRPYANYFYGGSERDTCRNIYQFLRDKTIYQKDGINQDIQLPSRFLNRKKADCKTYSLLTSSILCNLKIPHCLVYTSYDFDPLPKHVYVITDTGYIIDGVWGKKGGDFNSEKVPTFKYKKKINPMNVRIMGDLDSPSLGKINLKKPLQKVVKVVTTIPKKELQVGKKIVQTAGKVYKKEFDIAKTVTLAPGRTLLLLAIKENYNGLGNAFFKYNRAKLLSTWQKVGGNTSDLQNAMNIGNAKPPKKSSLLRKIAGIIGGHKVAGIGCCFSASDKNKMQGIGVVAETAATVSFGALVMAILPVLQDILKLIPPKVAKATSDVTTPTGPTGNGEGTPLPPEGGVLPPGSYITNPNGPAIPADQETANRIKSLQNAIAQGSQTVKDIKNAVSTAFPPDKYDTVQSSSTEVSVKNKTTGETTTVNTGGDGSPTTQSTGNSLADMWSNLPTIGKGLVLAGGAFLAFKLIK